MHPRLSLRYRIATTIFALEALMVGVILWQMTLLTLHSAREQQLVHEEVTLGPLADFSRIALLTDEYSDVQNYFQKVVESGDVKHIVLADLKQRVVASSSVQDIGRPPPAFSDHDQRYWRVRDIGNAGGKMGILAVEFSQVAMLDANKRILKLGITLALAGMVIIAIVGYVLGRLLTRKLDALATSVKKFAAGEKRAVTSIEGDDEIGQVGRTFNQMALTIEQQISEIKQSRASFELAISGTNDGIWDWNVETGVASFSDRWYEMLGEAGQDIRSTHTIQDWQARLHPDDRESTLKEFNDYLAGPNEFFVSEHRLRHNSGDYLWFLIRGKALRNADGQVLRMAGSLTDITARRRQAEAMQHQALHDALTGLPNRTLFHDRLAQAIHVSEREQKPFSILMLDLNQFKAINDTLGHHVGDLVLQEVAKRIQSVLRASDTVSRFGGDEFVMLLPGCGTMQSFGAVEKIRKAFEPSFSVDRHMLMIEGSIGIVVYPEHGTDANTLIKRADVAMYTAKKAETGFAFYDSRNDPNTPDRLVLFSQLRQGIENNELVLYYQPKVNLRTNVVYGVEALVRWQHPHLGLLYPNDFLPLAEGSGLINPLTYWVLDTALRQLAQWRAKGHELITAINLSVRNLQDLEFPDRVAERLKFWDVEPKSLELEITESAIMVDPERARKVLGRLDEMGVALSIDDFGTGYSSLAYLKKLPVDEIKIDRSFVMDMLIDESNQTIVQSTIDLGHNLGMTVVAEGVETMECWNLLRTQGCDAAQGYYISRPMPSQELTNWLARWSTQPRLKSVVSNPSKAS